MEEVSRYVATVVLFKCIVHVYNIIHVICTQHVASAKSPWGIPHLYNIIVALVIPCKGT